MIEPIGRPVEELPPPSAPLVVVRTGAQALIRALGRRKAEKFVREWATLFSTQESVELLLPARTPSERRAVAKAQREAMAWFREVLPTLLASIPKE